MHSLVIMVAIYTKSPQTGDAIRQSSNPADRQSNHPPDARFTSFFGYADDGIRRCLADACQRTLSMDLNLNPQEEAFRDQVRGRLAHNRPVAMHQRGVVEGKTWVQRAKDWQRRLYEAGYLALAWPREYGGQALDPMRQAIVSEELMRANVPGVIGSNSIGMLGPTLITWGTEEQKRRYLPKILTAEEIWCQGYSEPGAGSDLASLRTRADL